jgi:hypothetical protein
MVMCIVIKGNRVSYYYGNVDRKKVVICTNIVGVSVSTGPPPQFPGQQGAPRNTIWPRLRRRFDTTCGVEHEISIGLR